MGKEGPASHEEIKTAQTASLGRVVLCGVDETRTRDPLRDRQVAFNQTELQPRANRGTSNNMPRLCQTIFSGSPRQWSEAS